MNILHKPKKSKFRSSFYLDNKDKEYIGTKGFPVIEKHAEDFIRSRLKVRPKNDSRQTPWRGHPVFKAQHATATCCRKCIEKWHKIPKNKELDEREIRSIKEIIAKWISNQARD